MILVSRNLYPWIGGFWQPGSPAVIPCLRGENQPARQHRLIGCGYRRVIRRINVSNPPIYGYSTINVSSGYVKPSVEWGVAPRERAFWVDGSRQSTLRPG